MISSYSVNPGGIHVRDLMESFLKSIQFVALWQKTQKATHFYNSPTKVYSYSNLRLFSS